MIPQTEQKKNRDSTQKKIVLLSAGALTSAHISRMGVRELSKHFEVVVFDLRPWLNRNLSNNSALELSTYNVQLVASLLEFRSQLKIFAPTYCFEFIGKTHISEDISTEIHNASSHLVLVNRGAIPAPNLRGRIKFLFRRMLRIGVDDFQIRLIRFCQDRENNIPSLFSQKQPPNLRTEPFNTRHTIRAQTYRPYLSLISGRKALTRYYRRSSRVFFVKSIDGQNYSEYLQQKSSKAASAIQDKYIVFLDDNIAGSPDWTLLNDESPVDEFHFYAELRDLFDRIEEHWNMPIIIAAHPTREITKITYQLFGHREIILNNTIQLVDESEIVVSISSTAINFAVLTRKPVILLTSNEINRNYLSLVIQSMKDSLKVPLINMSKRFNLESVKLRVIDKRYDDYISNFINYKCATRGNPWSQVCEALLENDTSKNK